MKTAYASLDDALSAVHDHRRERPFRCHVHDDTQASASVNVGLGVWVCYACGAAGKTDGLVYETDAKELAAELEYLFSHSERPSEEMVARYCAEPHPYWLSRFTPEAVAHFQLGFNPDTGMPVYPMRAPGGELLGFVSRSLTEDGPKYKYPPGVAKAELLFNYEPMQRDTVLLVEGAMDVVAAWEVGSTAFGIYGSKLSIAQTLLVHKLSPARVVLAFDNDAAGALATQRAHVLLERYYELYTLPWWQWSRYKDIGEMPLNTRRIALEDIAPL